MAIDRRARVRTVPAVAWRQRVVPFGVTVLNGLREAAAKRLHLDMSASVS